MTADAWVALGALFVSLIGHGVRSAVLIARLQEKLVSIESRQGEHLEHVDKLRDAINELEKAIERLATIEELRSQEVKA